MRLEKIQGLFVWREFRVCVLEEVFAVTMMTLALSKKRGSVQKIQRFRFLLFGNIFLLLSRWTFSRSFRFSSLQMTSPKRWKAEKVSWKCVFFGTFFLLRRMGAASRTCLIQNHLWTRSRQESVFFRPLLQPKRIPCVVEWFSFFLLWIGRQELLYQHCASSCRVVLVVVGSLLEEVAALDLVAVLARPELLVVGLVLWRDERIGESENERQGTLLSFHDHFGYHYRLLKLTLLASSF